uniref:Uncharacterized protein n=1 Tax=Arundo donax TaxID=35708 RepID=A0A0A8Z0Q7_ARUDO
MIMPVPNYVCRPCHGQAYDVASSDRYFDH